MQASYLLLKASHLLLQASYLLLKASHLLTQCLDLLRPKRCPAYLEITSNCHIAIKEPCRIAFAKHAGPATIIGTNYGSMIARVTYPTHTFICVALTKDANTATIIGTNYGSMVLMVPYSTHTFKSSTLTKDANASGSVFAGNSRRI
jgi:hypothetical protein